MVSAVFAVAFVSVHFVDTFSVMTRIVFTVVDVQLAVSSIVAGLADALIAAERVCAVAVLTRTVLALVDVLFTELALETDRTRTTEAGHTVNAGTIVLTFCIAKT